MKRARPGLLLAGLALLANGLLTTPARADCADDIQVLRAQLGSIKDPHHRDELQMLIDKAEKDNAAGRGQLCNDAMQRARLLVKG
jgi:hypothetical protein